MGDGTITEVIERLIRSTASPSARILFEFSWPARGERTFYDAGNANDGRNSIRMPAHRDFIKN